MSLTTGRLSTGSLTTGRLNERRRVGGQRAAIRSEVRKARRKGNKQLAQQLDAQLAEININRDSLIGSADSDIRANRLREGLAQHEARQAEKVLRPREGGLAQVAKGSEPAQGVNAQVSPTQTTAPTNTQGVGTGSSTLAGVSRAKDFIPGVGAVVAGTDTVVRDGRLGEGRIGGKPAGEAIAELDTRLERSAQIEDGVLPFNPSDEEADRFEELHGRESLIRELSKEADQRQERRELADKAHEQEVRDFANRRKNRASELARVRAEGAVGSDPIPGERVEEDIVTRERARREQERIFQTVDATLRNINKL